MKMVTVLLSLIFLNVAALADENKPWQEKLETAITEGIKLLEGKEYVKFLKAFVEPPELEELSKGDSIEAFAEKFAVSKGPQLLSVLKNIRGRTPTMEENDTKATYEVNVEGVSKKSITFRKHGKNWHISNK